MLRSCILAIGVLLAASFSVAQRPAAVDRTSLDAA
jgi:hypothetical protein